MTNFIEQHTKLFIFVVATFACFLLMIHAMINAQDEDDQDNLGI